MQSRWDEGSVYIHRPSDETTHRENGVVSSELALNFVAIWRVMRARSPRRLVFHAQSSLPYLLFARMAKRLLGRDGVTLVYDMHDLHEAKVASTRYRRLRYGMVRHGILGACERVVCRDRTIPKLTVSAGISKAIAERYACDAAAVVANVGTPERYRARPWEMRSTASNLKPLLYFGTKNHAPLSLIPEIRTEGLELHLHGRDMNEDWLAASVDGSVGTCVRVFGGFDPEDMEFLSAYDVLVLYRPEVGTLNYRFALPNKAFQALWHGLSVIVSTNFAEVKEAFGDIRGAVATYEGRDDLASTIAAVLESRGEDYEHRIQEALWKIYTTSKRNYLAS
jgi:hypothetical protein